MTISNKLILYKILKLIVNMETHRLATPSLPRRLSTALWELRVLGSLDSSEDILSHISRII